MVPIEILIRDEILSAQSAKLINPKGERLRKAQLELASPAGRAEKNTNEKSKMRKRSSSNNSTTRPAPFRAMRITRLPTLVVFPGEDPHLGRVGERGGKGGREKSGAISVRKLSFGSTVAVAYRL